jgi:VCBS repeat-containing protein
VTDGTDVVSNTATYTITGINDAPNITAIIANQINDDSDVISLDLSVNFDEIDNGDSITFSAAGLPPGLSIDPNTGVVSGIIASSASVGGISGLGDYTVTITASDVIGAANSQVISWQVNNIEPIAVDDSFTTNEDTPINDSIADGVTDDRDPDGDVLSYALTTGASNGGVTFNNDGSFTYSPNLNFNGSDSFTYQITDADGATANANVSINVISINDAPITSTIADQTASDSIVINLDVASFFSDVDNDSLAFSAINLPLGLTINTAGIISGSIDSSASVDSPYLVTVTAVDGNGGSIANTFNWVINNIPPQASDNNGEVIEDTVLNNVGNVITDTSSSGTDSDADNDALNISVVNGINIATGGTSIGGVYGELIIATDGSYTYNLNNLAASVQGLAASATVTESFTYTLVDADGAFDDAVLMITVTGINDAPIAVDDVSYSTAEDMILTIPAGVNSLLANDSDVDNDTLTINSTPVSLPNNGTIIVNEDGSFSYVPNTNFNGIDTFVYEVNDGEGGTATATVSIEVVANNDAPEIVSIIPDRTDQDSATISLNTSAFFTDLDGDTLSFNAIDLPAGLSIDPISGIITGQIAADASVSNSGVYSVSVTATDQDNASITDTFIWTITNPAPVLDLALPDRIDQDSENVSLDTSAFFTDPDGDMVSYSVNVLPAGLSINSVTGLISGVLAPTANLNSPYTVTITADDQQGGVIADTFIWTIENINPIVANPIADQTNFEGDGVSIDVTEAFANPDNDSLTYSAIGLPVGLNFDPNTGLINGVIDSSAAGIYTVSITADDGSDAATDQFIWTITNPAPIVITPESDRSDLEGAAVSIDASLNFIDPDSDIPLTYTATGLPNGVTIDSATGLISGILSNTASNNGPYSVTVTVDDGEGGIVDDNFNWSVANIAPTADDLTLNINEDGSVNGSLTSLVNDDDGDPLVFSISSNVNHGVLSLASDGSFNYRPNVNFFGSDLFTYQVSDGQGGTATATVTLDISSVNDAPIASNDNYSTDEDSGLSVNATDGVLTNDTDIEMDALTVALETDTTNGSLILAADGSFVYTPNVNFNGSDSFVYTIDDGNGSSATATVTLNVIARNDDPIAMPNVATTLEDQSLRIELLANASDIDGDMLIVFNANSDNGSIFINADNSIIYTPDANFNGLDEITYIIRDGKGGTATSTVAVTVTPLNDNPIAIEDSVSTDEDTAVNIDVLSNDSDIDADIISVSSANATNGIVSVNIDGSLNYTPSANFNGTDTITYSVSDGNGGTASSLVSVVVNPLNDAPNVISDTAATNEDTAVNINVLANDSDVDGDAIIVDSASASNGTVSINLDGTLTYNPNLDFAGTDTISYSISDGNGGTAAGIVAVVVLPINDSIIANDDLYSLDEDNELVVPAAAGLLSNDTDDDGDLININRVVVEPTNGLLVLNANGSFNYTPDLNFNGVDSYAYEATDGNGSFSQATVTINVTSINDIPNVSNDSYMTPEDTLLAVNIADGVLANDSDADGDTLIVNSVIAEPSNGVLTLNDNGSFTYLPNANFAGTDSFVYEVIDRDGATVQATVAIIISAVDDGPIAIANSFTVIEDSRVAIEVLLNDIENDGENLFVSEVNGLPISVNSSITVSNGVVTLAAENTLIFIPAPNFNGNTEFTYTVSDGIGSDTASVNGNVISANDLPFVSDSSIQTAENRPINIDVLTDATDIDGDELTVIEAFATNGIARINPDGTIDYMPYRAFVGFDTITFTISDGNGGTVIANILVTVLAEPNLVELIAARPNLAAPSKELVMQRADIGIDFSTTNFVIDAAALSRPGVTRPDANNKSFVIDTAYNSGIPFYDYNKLHVIDASTNIADFADRRYLIDLSRTPNHADLTKAELSDSLVQALTIQSAETVSSHESVRNLGKLSFNQQLSQQQVNLLQSMDALTLALQSTEREV